MDNWGRRGGKEASGQREETNKASHNSSPFKDEMRNADVVLFSNFSSPEYIMELWKTTQYQRSLSHTHTLLSEITHWSPLSHTQLTVEQRDSWRRCPDSHVGCQIYGKSTTNNYVRSPPSHRKTQPFSQPKRVVTKSTNREKMDH
uniref:Uncharacterized protein n=1 Tax=Oncorhynchus mykiss TaxID=8022 RepID=A0A8C7W8E6_ONCMY